MEVYPLDGSLAGGELNQVSEKLPEQVQAQC